MFCTKCGAQVADDDAFCSKCGQRIRRTPSQPEKIEQRGANNRKGHEISKSPPHLSDEQIAKVGYVTSCASTYVENLRSQWQPNTMTSDWWHALHFWFSHAFYRGRRDSLSAVFQERAMTVVKETLGTTDRISLDALSEEDLQAEGTLDSRLLQAKLNNRYDRQMVLSTLAYIRDLDGSNIVAHSLEQIRSGMMEEHYRSLMTIRAIGPKLATFYLRDLDILYDLREYLPADGYVMMQPLDTWVMNISSRIGIIPANEPTFQNQQLVVEACLEAGANPNLYNIGAYWIGSQGQLSSSGL